MTSASGLAITASSTPCTTPKTSFSLPGSPTAATSIGADRPKPVGSRYGKPKELVWTQVPTDMTRLCQGGGEAGKVAAAIDHSDIRGLKPHLMGPPESEIGRASCRERV